MTANPMSYVIVAGTETILGDEVYTTFDTAFDAANEIFGRDVETWLAQNVRIEEDR
jgi:hypothetical protein